MADSTHQSLAAVLDDLCQHPVGRRTRPFTNIELAQLVCTLGGDITDGYISHLRNGQRDNPTLQTLEDLALALQVCPAVFVGGRKQRRGDERPRQSFPGKLRRLFDKVHPPGRGPFTAEETAKSISAKGTYGSISPNYVRELLNPHPDSPPNPRLKHILGLADHFGLADDDGLRAEYFLDDELAGVIDEELDDFVTLRDAGVFEFVTRMAEEAPQWTPDMRRHAIEAITQAVELGETNYPGPVRNESAHGKRDQRTR